MDRDEIISTIFDNMASLKRGMYTNMEDFWKALPVSRAQLELLYTIKHLEPVSAKQLAAHLQLTPGAVSQLLESLTHDGLVERKISPSDRRTQRLRLSPGGIKLLKGIEKGRRKYMERIMQHLSNRELATWADVQQKIITELQKSNKDIKGDAHEAKHHI